MEINLASSKEVLLHPLMSLIVLKMKFFHGYRLTSQESSSSQKVTPLRRSQLPKPSQDRWCYPQTKDMDNLFRIILIYLKAASRRWHYLEMQWKTVEMLNQDGLSY